MKALLRLLLLLVVVGGLVLYVISVRNNTSLTPQTIDLAVDCSDLNNLLVTSTVNVDVRNLIPLAQCYNGQHNRFRRGREGSEREKHDIHPDLAPHSNFDKPVTLPAETKRCDCKIVSSHPTRL